MTLHVLYFAHICIISAKGSFLKVEVFKHSLAMRTLEPYLICKSASSVNHQNNQLKHKNYLQHLKFLSVYYCNSGDYYALILNNLFMFTCH